MCRQLWPDVLNQGLYSQLRHKCFFIWENVNICAHDWFSPLCFFAFPELLWAGDSISEHCISLQHEISGGDHWLVACHEPTDQPKHSLDWILPWLFLCLRCLLDEATSTPARQTKTKLCSDVNVNTRKCVHNDLICLCGFFNCIISNKCFPSLTQYFWGGMFVFCFTPLLSSEGKTLFFLMKIRKKNPKRIMWSWDIHLSLHCPTVDSVCPLRRYFLGQWSHFSEAQFNQL